MANEERFSSPFVGHILSFGDIGQIDFDLGQSQNVGGSGHAHHKLGRDGFAKERRAHASACKWSKGKGKQKVSLISDYAGFDILFEVASSENRDLI